MSITDRADFGDIERIEEEIDQLKVDVQRLREGSSAVAFEDREQMEESSAARLERLHKLQGLKKAHDRSHFSAAPPPSPGGFPTLRLSQHSSKAVTPADTREASYARAAAGGMMNAIDQAFAPEHERVERCPDLWSPPTDSSSRSTVRTVTTSLNNISPFQDGEDASVIISPTDTVHEPLENGEVRVLRKVQAPVDHGKMSTHVPRFAQPTESFARRAGSTVRKDSTCSKAAGETIKSVKSKQLDEATTAKFSPQRQHKRGSLPGDWLGKSNEDLKKASPASTIKVKNSSPAPSPATTSPIVRSTDSAIKTKNNESALQTSPTRARNKASSYMSPTSATTQRTAETVRVDRAKHEPSRAKLAGLKVDTDQAHRTVSTFQAKSRTSATGNSPRFIKERAGSSSPGSRADVKGRNMPKNTKSPLSAHRYDAVGPVDCSPTKIPRPSMLEQLTSVRQTRDTNSRSSNSSSLPSMPFVANTQATRRMSHGDMLNPIKARLDAEGLLQDAGTGTGTTTGSQQQNGADKPGVGHARRAQRQAGLRSQRNSENRSEVSVVSLTTCASSSVPAHLKENARHASSVSSSSGSTLCAKPHNCVAAEQRETQRPVQPSYASIAAGTSTNEVRTASSASKSLRATAQEFRPRFNTAASAEQRALNINAAYGFGRSESMMPPCFQAYEHLPQLASHPLSEGPAPHLFNHYWATGTGAMDPCITQPSVHERGPANGMCTGQTLRPALSPGKKHVHWTLCSTDGTEKPVQFGRAPGPTLVPMYNSPASTGSSNSTDTSPPRTPRGSRQSPGREWAVDAASAPSYYGWKGGDGKEIRFVGYGPHAERDPGSIVNFEFQGRSTSLGRRGGDQADQQAAGALLAPRSQRQWADKFGYDRVPCGAMEITHAMEFLPFMDQLAGYCHDCYAR